MDESDSARERPLEKVELAGGGRWSPRALALAQDDSRGAQFTAIAHFQPAASGRAERVAEEQTSCVASGRRPSATSHSISSGGSQRDELESNESFGSSRGSRSSLSSGGAGGSGSRAGHTLAAQLDARLDRMKALEELTLEKVAESSMGAEAKNSEQALRSAREAMEVLNRLRASELEQQRLGSAGSEADQDSARESAPMSSGVNSFDLLVMAKSNLAAQLRRAGQLDEALELYTQLCKLASAQSGPAASGRAPPPPRFLLYRFGLQMGNVLLEMGEHARALKHFRLTLDRLSSSGQQQRQLRVKLMSNIAVALMGAHREQRDTAAPPDHLGAMQRLLADNLMLTSGAQQPQAPLNANHHRFGLNLVSSYREQAELGAMRAALGQLVKVDICHHYARVLSDLESADGNQKRGHGPGQPAESSSAAAHARGQSGAPTSPDMDAEPRQRQAMSAIRTDKLESLICERHDEIARALLASCALITDQAGRPESTGATKEDATTGAQAIANRAQVGRSAQAAATAQCVKLLAASDRYGRLASELRLHYVFGSLPGRRKLRSALCSLVEAARDEQRAAAAPGGGAPAAAARTKWSSAPQQVAERSPMVAANLALLCNAAGRPAKALELVSMPPAQARASPLLCASGQISVANCHVAIKEFERAEAAAERALDLEPTSWLANYNRLLIARLAGRHFEELDARTRKSLAAQLLEMGQPRALAKLHLAQLQLALFYKQSAMDAKSAALFERIAGGAHADTLAPELSLQASRATPDEATSAILRATSLRHAYHMPTAERLVALHISRFQYREAELLLAACLRNRPDQARWLQLLAECHRRAARYPEAIRVYKHAMGLFPADTGCLHALAKLADELGLTHERDLCLTRLKTISESRAKLQAAATD